MSKQTAVQILVESMTTSDVSFYSKEIAIALQIEREQIIDAYNSARNDHHQMYFADEYFIKTYGGQDE
jgi:hypothetical protein